MEINKAVVGMLKSWERLNSEQLRAVENQSGKTLVNACAGSGKTSTATGKVAGWVEQGVAQDKILMLTFTRKAATEMKDRVAVILGGEVDIEGGTYHSVAVRLMRAGARSFEEVSGFSIMDQDDAKRLWSKILRDHSIEPKYAGLAMSTYSLAVNQMVKASEGMEKNEVFRGKGILLEKAYQASKERLRVMDFDDILSAWLRALQKGGGGLGRWTHVMVDELQDNSEIQYQILKHLGAEDIFAVGDPNQCIYSFRGSAPKLMKRFSQEYPECKEYTLNTNHRSGRAILNIANQAMARGDNPVFLKSWKEDPGKVYQYKTQSAQGEANCVADLVKWRLRAGHKPSQIAVLFRSRFQSHLIELSLTREKIAYRKYGGQDIFHASEVKDYISLLKAWKNPTDKLAVARVAMLFPGVGKKSVDKITEDGQTKWPAKGQEAELWISQANALSWPEAGKHLASKIIKLFPLNYPQDADERSQRILDLAETCEGFSDATEMIDYYALGESKEKGHPDHCITLSTIHSAKGLEWKNVIVHGASHGQLPSLRSKEHAQREEERRLFYVATTRAKEFLCFTHSSTSATNQFQDPTPFLPRERWTPPPHFC
jgi:DNA helicase-2/ATP-dependent DNA helicase PcrA